MTVAMLGPAATEAQEPNPAETERKLNDVRTQRGEIDLQVNGLAAEDAQVRAAVAALETNVASQQAELDEAERAAEAAEAEVVTASAAVEEQEGRIDDLNDATDALVVEAFVNPPSDNALDSFKADSLSDATVKQALVDIQADSDADLMDQLEQAHEDLEVDKADKETLAAEAETKREAAETALTELENALDQQEEFAAQVEERLNAKLAEVESLKATDLALSQQLLAEQTAITNWLNAVAQVEAQRRAEADAAAAAAAAAAASRGSGSSGGGGGSGGGRRGGIPDPAPSVVLPAPGGLARVSCPS
ncbi:MAG TPA: hypothetical protein VFI47_09645, partial [Acidimicrobiales bacterium]|nr:hypothetical protein [Acidimicrobiales bacterium]